MSDNDQPSKNIVTLPHFPSEEPLSHEGRNWNMGATTKLAPYELIVVAETGAPPILREIVDVDLDDYPELAEDHPGRV